MAKHAVIVESPAKTRTLERFLGSDYKCLASMGHVRDLPRKELGVDIENNFRPHYEVIPSAKKVISSLRKALKDVDAIYLASDPDREGEAIGWHLVQALKLPNPRRIRFNEITETAVKEALENADEIDMNRVDAQQARRVLDRLVGYLISPVLWKRIKTGSQALSAGRVQSVALRMIVERERAIAAFEAEEYWTIEALLTPLDREAQFAAELQTRDGEKLELRTQEEAEAAATELKQAEYAISDIAKQTRRRNPAPPFITSTLQQQASGQLRFSARKTMAVAQQLYEGIELPDGMTALITYMRTDSTRIADSARQEAAHYIKDKFGQEYVGQPRAGKAKKGVQDAHEAVRPTDVVRDPDSVKEYLTSDQLRLYELIWRRFVASQMAAAVFDVTTVDIAAGRYGLRATGSVPVFAGYRSVYEEARPDDEADKNGKELPELNKGEALKLLELTPDQHFTKPPPRFTEATLVRALEENGIGRPSTYSDIIETLRQRKYAYMQKRAFVPTRLGVVVCDYLVEHFGQVMDIQFTARVEADLDTVERGEQDWVQLVRGFYEPLSSWIEKAETAPPKRLGEKCPECGGELVERYSASGRFAGCESFPKCEYTRDLDSGLPEPEVPDLEDEECPECGEPLTVKQGPRGPFIGCTGYPKCRYTRPIDGDGSQKPPPVETDIECEECGKLLVVRTGKRGPFLGCTGFPKCRFTRNLTAEEAERFSVPAAETQPEGLEAQPPPDAKCPECGADMVARSGRRGQFLGCSRYPQCRGTRQLDGSASAGKPRAKPEPIGEDCPECGKPLVVRSGRRGKFVGCSGYPKCRYVRDFSG